MTVKQDLVAHLQDRHPVWSRPEGHSYRELVYRHTADKARHRDDHHHDLAGLRTGRLLDEEETDE